ncbi:MAG: hypothetical protein IJX39_04825 [Clostridia bacterium]|nr:hypothetical protein [Clostridia bacterium]MBQ8357114.1 hypothetical protein [Clostridia bacterium]
MKRILSVLLCLVLLMTVFVSCDDDSEKGEDVTLIAPDDLPVIRNIGHFDYACFADEASNTTLRLKLPKDWSYTASSGSYSVSKEGITVGSVSTGKPADANMTGVKTMTGDAITVEILTGMLTREDTTEPYYQILFSFDENGTARCITLEVKQSEMDAVMIKWCSQPELLTVKGYNDIPVMPLSQGNGSTRILMLGNSFLYDRYSNIKAILQELIDASEKECTVVRGAFGYASVESFATSAENSYPTIRSDIAAGRFSVVFLCGLYNSADLACVQTMIDLCADSGTRLVLLPAHNESATQIANAADTYPNTPILNWKEEIDALIDNGVAKADFVNNDTHGHSTALAGYVGAHMIYRSLFGEIPPDLPSDCEAISQSTVNSLLGTYAKEGIQWVEETEIKRLK